MSNIQYSIKINIIAPGLINTKFAKNIPEVSKEIYRSQNLSGELTNIDEDKFKIIYSKQQVY